MPDLAAVLCHVNRKESSLITKARTSSAESYILDLPAYILASICEYRASVHAIAQIIAALFPKHGNWLHNRAQGAFSDLACSVIPIVAK